MIELEADVERLKVEYAQLMERKREQERQLQTQSVYQDYMDGGL